MQGYGFKLFAVVALVLISLWQLFPTLQNTLQDRDLAAMSAEERAAYEQANYEDLTETREASLNLGLDLQGGMHVTLEVGTGALLNELAGNRADDTFNQALELATERTRLQGGDFVDVFEEAVEGVRPGTRLARYFRDTDAGVTARSSNAEVVTYLRAEVDEALSRAEEIIRQRVDRYGVTEPLIQRQDGSRIVVELPGVDDPQRVRDLLRGTAKLTFHLTPPTQELQQAASRVFAYYEGGADDDALTADADTTADGVTADGDTTADALDLAEITGGAAPEAAAGGNPLVGKLQLIQVPEGSPVFGQVAARDTAEVLRLLEDPGAQQLLPPGVELLLTATPEGVTADGDEVYYLLGVNERVELSGDVVTDAGPDFDPYTNAAQVSLTMNGVGGSRWSQITGANIGRPVAVVLDDRVYTYPTIQGRIPNGRTQITGQFTRQDVDDIVTVLKSGALPAPVRIVEERTVGPSLGAASIRAGTRALLVGFLLVGVFMVFYYRGAGLVANLALLLNVLFIFGVLASFSATLTLPGMAGIVLTIGMAVDANVLIFERIREELGSGKTMRAAVDGGFAKALSAIADANITTFLIGVILYSFGVGPIQGFAVTLMAGILTSLFTALVVTRLVLDYFVQSRGTTVAFG